MINNKKIISVGFIFNKSLKQQNNKNYLRTSNILRNRFSTCNSFRFTNQSENRNSPLSGKPSQNFLSNKQFNFVKSNNLNFELLKSKNLELNGKTQISSLFKMSSVFTNFVHLNSSSNNAKNKNNFNGDFFPSKKAFIHYWIFPFVGFAGYVYLNKYNSNLTNVDWAISQPKNNSDILNRENQKFESYQKHFESFDKTRTSVEFSFFPKMKKNLQSTLFNTNPNVLKSKVLNNEKEESKTAFFITNFLKNIETTKNLNNQLLPNNSFTVGHPRKQWLTSQVPHKLLPICKNIKLENYMNKLGVDEKNMIFHSFAQNSNVSHNPIYSYRNAINLIYDINLKLLLSQNLTDFNLKQTSQRINSNKQYLNSELIKQVNQILTISRKNNGYLYPRLSTQTSIVKNIKEFEKSPNFLPQSINQKGRAAICFPSLLSSKSETLKNNFHALFLVKYLLKKTENKHIVNNNLILTPFFQTSLLQFKNQQQIKSSIIPVLSSDLYSSYKLFFKTEKNVFGYATESKVNLKMQDFLLTLNKIQTRDNLEFINRYKNTFPLLSKNFNNFVSLRPTNSVDLLYLAQLPSISSAHNNLHVELSVAFPQGELQKQKDFIQSNQSLNNLKWNLYELATLRFFKNFLNPPVKEISNNLYKLKKLKQPYGFAKNSSLQSTKLSSILKTFYNKKNANIVKSMPFVFDKDINLNTNKLFYYQNFIPMCFSVSLNEKISNTSFFHLKNSMLLGRNLENNMTYSLIKAKATESILPISVFPADSFMKKGEELKTENNSKTQHFKTLFSGLKTTNNVISKFFTVSHSQNNKLFIEHRDYFLENKMLELDKSNTSTIFTSNLLFKDANSNVFSVNKIFQKNKKSFILRLKSKKQYKTTYNLYFKKLGLRSQEKVFRAYLSNKYNENNIKSSTSLNYFYVQKTLKKLKKRFFSNTKNNFKSKLEKHNVITSFETQKGNLDTFDFNYSADQHRYSPNTLLRKLGFLFKYQKEFLNKETWDRVEKHRSSQKKRRRKKQKRFYPRPSWLRFLLYRNFLTLRHSYLDNSTFLIKKQIPCLTSIQQNNKSDSFYYLSPLSQSIMPLKGVKATKKQGKQHLNTTNNNNNIGNYFNSIKYLTHKQFVTKIFRNNKKNQVLQQKYTSSMELFNKQLMHEKKTLNRISETLGLTNQNFLILQQSSDKNLMFHSQDYYQISNEVMSDFQKLCWKSYWLRSSLTPYIRRIQKCMQTIRKADAQSLGLNKFVNNSNLLTVPEKQHSDQFNWYLNCKNTMQLNSEISTFVNFQNLQNRSEYERMLYDRISDIIENVKANLDGSGQSRAKVFKVGRTRKDNLSLRRSFSMVSSQLGSQRKLNKYSEDSFISRFALFVNNNLNTPNINAFSLQSVMDQSIKPFGDLPTLRNLWALNRTHGLAGFAQAKTNSGQPDKAEWKQLTETKTLWSTLKFRDQNASNKTKKFFSLVWKKLMLMPFTYQGLNNLEKLSLQKLAIADKKLNYLGVYLKSNKSIFKYWKMNLPVLKSSIKSQILTSQNKETQVATLVQHQLWRTNGTTNLQSQKQAKRSVQFWWSFSEVTTGFHTFSFQKTFNPFNNSLISTNPQFKLNNEFLVFLSTLAGCTILFHLCSLYSFLQSSQIRSLAKFYILVLYKFSNAYLILVYAIFNFIKNYFKQLRFIVSILGDLKKRKKTHANFLAFSQYSSFDSPVNHSNSQRLNSLNKVSFDFLTTKNQLLDKTYNLKRNQIFFYGSFIQNSFRQHKHFYLLTNLKDTKNTTSQIHLQRDNENFLKAENKQNHLKNNVILKFLNLEAFKVRFFSNAKKESNFFVTIPKSQQFSILEMCFYSPNLKVKDLQLNQLQQNNFLLVNPTLMLKNKQFQSKNTLFEVNKNFVYSSPKNLKNFIFDIITNSQKQKLTGRLHLNKDALVTKKFLIFSFNKSFQHFYAKLWVGLLLITKASVSLVYNTIGFGSLILFKIIDILESLMMLIYKFLEKPAEFMIEWIAQLFLVEWSSDITTFVPESFDIYTWRSFTKLSRGSRIFSVFGFLMQRRLWCLFEIYLNLLSKPDADLLNRQRKGMIFWDVWAEILITAAEKYRINLSSLTTVKEEQEAFLERLLNDPYWLSSCSLREKPSTNDKQATLTNFKKIAFAGSEQKQTRALAELELLATAGNRPESWLGRQSFFIKEASFSKNFFKVNKKMLTTGFQNQFMNLIQNSETPRLKYNFNYLNNTIYNQSNKIKVKNTLSTLPSFTFKNENLYFVSDFNVNWKSWQRWSTNQHFTSQGSDTELFIDVHPPKSFAYLSQLKSSQSGISSGIAGLSTLGSLTCMIYSGLFSKQVSKNILIVGSPGNSQTMLIQALAGETELKMIADNAHRYAHIQRGIAVGMKLLRDVFDGLALHTPCLFLMEDIHVIGERRPMLISDNENVKAAESSFAAENEEVHEKNMFIYQLNKHAITDYRKPYKGDFSLLIPTNHFCFDLFLGVSPPKIRKTGKTPRSPFALETKFYEMQKDNNSSEQENKSTNIILKTLLQKNSEQFFAPPATSPFNILGMKEQRQFKAKQVVKEIPWGGFSNDQMMLLPKATYSIRVKIALLADLAMNQLSVKLDMITDLLVIMDNVRSNRGFVVFATTHVPFVLDPALRRPGRLDETISLPFAPTLIDRFEILKTSLLNYTTTFDFMSYSFLLQNYTETDLSAFISRTKLLLFNNLNDYSLKLNQSYFSFPSAPVAFSQGEPQKQENQNFARKNKLDQTSISSLSTALSLMTQLEVTEPKKLSHRILRSKKRNARQALFAAQSQSQKINSLEANSLSTVEKEQKSILELLKVSKIRSSVSATPSTLVSITYSQIGKFILGSQILKDSRVFRTIVPSFEESVEDGEPSIFRNLYSSSVDIQNTLLYLLSGKAGEFFFFNQLKLLKNNDINSTLTLSKNSFSTFSLKPSLTNSQLNAGLWNVSTPLSQTNFTKNHSLNLANSQRGGCPQVEELWSSATSFVFALVQKRYLYHKTLLMNRLLYFNDISMLKEPPSPPGSSILMTTKKYENLKRTERDFQNKPSYSILEKIMLHQQQRFMKKLYEKPILEIFQSEMVQNRYTSFNSSIKELGYYDSFMRKPSSSQSFYKNRILTRHKFSFINQWWNGQLAEHNLESTFSSDVDWRSMFVETFGDLTIDFPDADQHYNPKSRRWFLQSTYGGYWNSFEKTISFEVYQHYIIISFNKAINYLHTEREILDSLAYTYLQKGSFKELDLLANLSRFNTSF